MSTRIISFAVLLALLFALATPVSTQEPVSATGARTTMLPVPVITPIEAGGADIEEPAPEVQTELVNPLKGKVFNQRCKVYETTDSKGYTHVNFDCVEDWAEKPLPGGCPDQYRNNMGSSSCNAAATSFVINMLADPELIQERIGAPGIMPDALVWDVYPILPSSGRITMNCAGASANTIKAAFEYFGLEARDIRLSEYTVAQKYEGLEDGELLVLALIGINAKGRRFQHYTVVSGVTEFSGHKTVTLYDSFFYKDPQNPVPDKVLLEESPNIKDDPTRYTGKKFDIVGAMVVRRSDIQPSLETEVGDVTQTVTEQIAVDSRFIVTTRESGDDTFTLGDPVVVGDNRYRREISLIGNEAYNAYYFDERDGYGVDLVNTQLSFKWNGYVIPLFEQDDPRWGGLKLTEPNANGKMELFVANGCGPTILASLLSMYPSGSEMSSTNPYELSQSISGYNGGMFAQEAMGILVDAGFDTDVVVASWQSIGKEIDKGKLVVVQADVNFHWGTDWVNHFVVVLDRNNDGSLLIYDPYWGPFVTHEEDIRLKDSAVFSVVPPSQ